MMMVEKKEERRAKVAGTCVIADGKFQPSGISGEVTTAESLGIGNSRESRPSRPCQHTKFFLFLYRSQRRVTHEKIHLFCIAHYSN